MSVPSSAHSSVASPAETRVRALLAQEKWRQARDELKALVKEDRPRFLPLLIEANVGLARKMAANGQASEARQVLNYLSTITPPAQLQALELEFAVTSGASEPLLQPVLTALADSENPIAEAERVRLADALVLSFSTSLSGNPARPSEAKVLEEMRAVHEALEAVSLGRWPTVTESLRRVSLRSIFGHWGVFVKGLAAYHGGDAERAVKLWTNLPPNSVPAKASRPYVQLTKPAAEPVPLPLLEGICRVVGATGAGDALTRAEQSWRKGKRVESYRQMSDAIANFPSAELDWAGCLTEFYFNTPHGLAQKDQLEMIDYWFNLARRDRVKNRVEARLSHRATALFGRAIAPADELREVWEDFLQERETALGPNPQLSSLAYEWLGEQLSTREPSFRFSENRPHLRDAEGAVTALRKSIDLDPANLAAHLKLCSLHETLNQDRERNRLLDQMTARFPDEQKVLVAAARGCLERKAFTKALDYLTRAREHDRLDPQIPELTVIALQALARDQFQQRRLEKARLTLARSEEFLIDDPKDFLRSRWSASARRAAMEKVWGDSAQAEALLAQARRQTSHAVAPLLLAHLTYRKAAKSHTSESPFFADLRAALRTGLTLGDLILPIRLLEEGRNRRDSLPTFDEDTWITQAIAGVSHQTFALSEATELIECAASHPAYKKPLRQLVKKLLRSDPENLQWRIWQLRLCAPENFDPEENRLKLRSIIDEATARRDEKALRQAREMLHELDEALGPESFDDDDDEFDDFDEEEFEAESGFPLPSPEVLEEIGEVMEILRAAEASPSSLREARKKLRGKVPDLMLDALIDLAKSGKLPPPPSPRSVVPKSSKRTPPPSDPNQGELF